MNNHIELVKKWLADKNSVTKEELNANRKAAYDAAYAAYDAAYDAAYASWSADDGDAYDAAADDGDAAYCVKRYEELTK